MLDYRTVVAPDFICKARIDKLLARAAEGNLTERGYAIRRKIQGSKFRNLTVVFRVVYARENDINPDGGDEVLKDSFGREIHLLEGVVLREVGEIDVKKEDLDEAHDLLTKSFKDFWNWREPQPAIRSEHFLLKPNTSSLSLKIEELSPFYVKRKPIPEPPVLVKILVFTTVALIILGFLLSTFVTYYNGKFTRGNPEQNTGTVVAYTYQEKKIELKNSNAQGSLTKLPEEYPNSAIFLSGSLKVKSSKEMKELPRSKENQTISLSNDTLEMKKTLLNREIARFLEKNVIDGTVTATIIQPSQDGIRPRLCFDRS